MSNATWGEPGPFTAACQAARQEQSPKRPRAPPVRQNHLSSKTLAFAPRRSSMGAKLMAREA
eukprot:9415936-Lingulodinium_polyedra.AAC.1